MRKAILLLSDGSFYLGTSFGSSGDALGEVCFNTGMTGYQEILTDPSYHSQVVLMTYPQIGNYGINNGDNESGSCYAKGLIVREHCKYPSNFESRESLDSYLKKNKVVGISGIDTRKLARIIRGDGAQKCIITKENNLKKIKEKVTAINNK